ncbi:carbohydrate ABC transporter permease [Paenibacillus eucommiae]|uniref:Multiple sugar transport system permease protein n=1 Tax=Paenibacillus eucommiae TaxID=1355755 RepID=A0ABS4IVY4_9BACL|nr:carbohydrate ABC transporter permease [Paenibacillus eucommiae]MBP1991744.1 multiple sugar transport system permease protein [Paenibacillus eucommiae]
MEVIRGKLKRWFEWPYNRNLWFLYRKKSGHLLLHTAVYLIVLSLSFIFLLPVLYMLVTSFKSLGDLLDSTIVWIPRAIQWSNFVEAARGLHLEQSIRNTLIVSVIPCVGQLISCSIAGYGFGRFRFPGHNLLFGLLLLSLLIPPQTIIISLFTLFQKIGWLNTLWPFIVPSFFAQGLRGALFVLIFSQFFRNLPRELEEAARIDGAGPIRLFTVIMLPLARPALFLVALFSFVWHWNDYYEPSLYLNLDSLFTLPIWLLSIGAGPKSTFDAGAGGQAGLGFNEPIIMAACLIVVVPLMVLYVFAQRYLKEGVERTGFGGE